MKFFTDIQKKLEKLNIYFYYTIIFSIISYIVFYTFIKFGKSFIWNIDGFKQHYIILYDFNRMIKNIFSNGVTFFSWNMGLGLDIIGQYSYYILGDPFTYISLLFPLRYLEYTYQILIILRMYFVGIAFIIYCRYNKKEDYNTLIGAIIYTFSGYIFFAAVRHPFFTNPVIMFPLVLIGIDKILKEDKYIWFTVTITILAIMNYYFLYMITILAVIYAIVKYSVEYRKNGIKEFGLKLTKTAMHYIIGIMIAAIILLPTIYAFLNSDRIGASYTYYDLKYYQKMFFGQQDTAFWSKSYISSIILLILPVSVLNIKGNKENKITLINIIISIIILMIPFLGSVMNGFSFQSNRWIFAYAFYMAYLVVINLRNDLKYTIKEIISIFIVLITYVALALIATNIDRENTMKLILVAALIGIVIIIKRIYENYSTVFLKICKLIIIILVSLNIVIYAWNLYSLDGEKYAFQFVTLSKVDERYNNYENKIQNFDKAIKYIKKTDKGFYRIGTQIYDINNMSIIHKYKGFNTYLSIGNGYVGRFIKELMIPSNNTTGTLDQLNELDSRTKLTSLLGCKYYIVSSDKAEYVPYGYELIKQYKSTDIYINQNNLTLGVFYDNYIVKDDYNKLSPLEKEQALMETAVINDNSKLRTTGIAYNEKLINAIKDTINEVEFTISDKNNYLNDKTFYIDFKEVENSELYLYFDNLEYNDVDKHQVKVVYDTIKKNETIENKVKSAYYERIPNILLNLGYKEKHSGRIEIKLTGKRRIYL